MEILRDNIKIQVDMYLIGQDLVINMYGGDTPHIGATTLGYKDTVETIKVIHHKDDVISKMVVQEILKDVDKTIVCNCGIHIESITKKQIQTIYIMTKELIVKIKEQIYEERV